MPVVPDLVPTAISPKQAALNGRLRSLGRVLVAYSGGVDSAFLAWAAHQALGSEMLAVIADSPSLARTHLADAIAFANEQGIPIEVIATSELDRPEYARNDSARCFHCKDELFTVMEELRQKRGFDAIAYGVNVDDQGDFRPDRPPPSAITSPRHCWMPDSPKRTFASWHEPPACVSGTNPRRPACPRALSTGVPSTAKR